MFTWKLILWEAKKYTNTTTEYYSYSYLIVHGFFFREDVIFGNVMRQAVKLTLVYFQHLFLLPTAQEIRVLNYSCD